MQTARPTAMLSSPFLGERDLTLYQWYGVAPAAGVDWSLGLNKDVVILIPPKSIINHTNKK